MPATRSERVPTREEDAHLPGWSAKTVRKLLVRYFLRVSFLPPYVRECEEPGLLQNSVRSFEAPIRNQFEAYSESCIANNKPYTADENLIDK